MENEVLTGVESQLQIAPVVESIKLDEKPQGKESESLNYTSISDDKIAEVLKNEINNIKDIKAVEEVFKIDTVAEISNSEVTKKPGILSIILRYLRSFFK